SKMMRSKVRLRSAILASTLNASPAMNSCPASDRSLTCRLRRARPCALCARSTDTTSLAPACAACTENAPVYENRFKTRRPRARTHGEASFAQIREQPRAERRGHVDHEGERPLLHLHLDRCQLAAHQLGRGAPGLVAGALRPIALLLVDAARRPHRDQRVVYL